MKKSHSADCVVFQNSQSQAKTIETALESPIGLTVNGQPWLTFMCTPNDLEALALGFLFNENVIQSASEVVDVRSCEHGDNVDVWLNHSAEEPKAWRRTSGCTGGITAAVLEPPETLQLNDLHLSAEQVHNLVSNLPDYQQLYRLSGGMHTSILSDSKKVLASAEDVGRHNTLDKITGKCLMHDIWPEQRLLITTGRISSEMLQKAARLNTAVLISRTSPSSLAVEMARKWGITLIGYARGGRFIVYSNPERINTPPSEHESAGKGHHDK